MDVGERPDAASAKTKIVDERTEALISWLPVREAPSLSARKSLEKFRDAIRAKTKRTTGEASDIVADVNRTLHGWFEYFKHSHRYTFSQIDGWVRMRLRSILRKRSGRKGRGQGQDHQRWPNAFFAGHGLLA